MLLGEIEHQWPLPHLAPQVPTAGGVYRQRRHENLDIYAQVFYYITSVSRSTLVRRTDVSGC